MLQISETAYQYLLRKNKLYFSQNRQPRLVLLARSCSGARFAICFDKAEQEEPRYKYRDLEILIDSALIEEFEGFELDTEQFFFAPRLLIKAKQNSLGCNCDVKCNNREVSNEAL